jgi:CelD/BcsL family acetyltransferase involved in cellulose biosynthesis
MQNLAIPFDRELVSGLAEVYGAAAGAPAHVVFRTDSGALETIGLFRSGLVRVLTTPTAIHIPYAGATVADTEFGETESIRTTGFGGNPLPSPDLLHLRGVPQSLVKSGPSSLGTALTVMRNRRYVLKLAGPGDSVFDYAPSGDRRRFRGLARSFGARFREVPPQERAAAAGQICDMFKARAMARGIAGARKLAEDRAATLRIVAHSSARVFVIENDAQLIAGTLGLVAGCTFYGLVSAGVAEGAIGRRSPGRLVKLAALDSLQREGVRAYDFGQSANPEKLMVCNVEEPVYDMLFPFSTAGRAAAAIVRGSRLVRSRLRDSEIVRRMRARLLAKLAD